MGWISLLGRYPAIGYSTTTGGLLEDDVSLLVRRAPDEEELLLVVCSQDLVWGVDTRVAALKLGLIRRVGGEEQCLRCRWEVARLIAQSIMFARGFKGEKGVVGRRLKVTHFGLDAKVQYLEE